MALYEQKRNDTEPMEATLTDRSGPIDLTGAVVRLFARGIRPATVKNISRTCTVVGPPTAGVVLTPWVTADVDTEGLYDMEHEITWNEGMVEQIKKTVPNKGYDHLRIHEDLG